MLYKTNKTATYLLIQFHQQLPDPWVKVIKRHFMRYQRKMSNHRLLIILYQRKKDNHKSFIM